MTLLTAFLVALIALVGGFVQSVAGFGSGIVMMLVLPHVLGYLSGPAVSVGAGFCMCIAIAWKYRRRLKLRLIALPAALYIAANVFTVAHVKQLKTESLALAFGAFLLLLSLYFLFLEPRLHFTLTTPLLVLFSLFSGTTAGLFGIGGPLMAVSFLELTDNREDYVANLQALFTLTGLSGIISRIAAGILTVELLPALVLSVAGILLGKTFGLKVASKLDGGQIKKMVYVLVGLCGVLTLVQNL